MENYDDLILAKGQEESAPEQPKEHKTFDKAAYAEKRQQFGLLYSWRPDIKC